MDVLTLEIRTPEQSWTMDDVTSLDVPAAQGRLTVLPGHAPLVCALEPGALVIARGEAEETWTGGTGTLQVTAEGVTLLLRSARPAT